MRPGARAGIVARTSNMVVESGPLGAQATVAPPDGQRQTPAGRRFEIHGLELARLPPPLRGALEPLPVLAAEGDQALAAEKAVAQPGQRSPDHAGQHGSSTALRATAFSAS
jgi:hypothetical protein